MPSRTIRLLVATALLALAMAFACRDRAPPPASPAGAPARPGDRYTVRGEIVRLPAPGATPREISIRHETIPDFRTASGEVVGMRAMVMPFTVAQGVPLDHLAVGDKISFRFVMDWPNNVSEIEAIEPLPAGAALDFGAR